MKTRTIAAIAVFIVAAIGPAVALALTVGLDAQASGSLRDGLLLLGSMAFSFIAGLGATMLTRDRMAQPLVEALSQKN